MKKFGDLPIVKDYKHKEKTKILKYIELMYSKGSDLVKIENMDERRKVACTKAGLNPIDHTDLLLLTKDSLEATLVFNYLSYFQNSNKFHNLMASQQLLWRLHAIMMSSDDSNLETAIKLSKESESLCNRIDNLMSEIYGAKEVVEAVATEIRKIIIEKTPEQRVREEVGEAQD